MASSILKKRPRTQAGIHLLDATQRPGVGSVIKGDLGLDLCLDVLEREGYYTHNAVEGKASAILSGSNGVERLFEPIGQGLQTDGTTSSWIEVQDQPDWQGDLSVDVVVSWHAGVGANSVVAGVWADGGAGSQWLLRRLATGVTDVRISTVSGDQGVNYGYLGSDGTFVFTIQHTIGVGSEIFLNGNSVATVATYTTALSTASGKKAMFGRQDFSGAPRPAKATLHSWRSYNRARSPDEIRRNVSEYYSIYKDPSKLIIPAAAGGYWGLDYYLKHVAGM